MDEIDLDQDLTDLELNEVGMTVKAAFDLRKALDKALAAIGDKNAERALVALNDIQDNIEEYGYAYGYGYPAPKAAPDTKKAKKLVAQAIDALEQDEPDYDKARNLLEQLSKALGYKAAEDAEGKASPEMVGLANRLMSAVGKLRNDKPDLEEIVGVLNDVLGKLQKYGKPGGKGLAIKILREEDGGVVVGGHLLLWGDPEHKDLVGDYFTPETELWLDEYKSVPALFHHGLDDEIGLTVVGHRVKAAKDKVGVWVEDWLDKSKKYWRMVKPLLEAEALYYSPGSAPHLVQRERDGELKSFPVVEDTMTPVPAQHRLLPIEHIKAVYAKANINLPAALAEADIEAELAQLERELKQLEV
jgi:hypothetical protein